MLRFVWVLALLDGCAAEAVRAPPPADPPDPLIEEAFRDPPPGPDGEAEPEPPIGAIEIYGLDLWGEPLATGFRISVTAAGADAPLVGDNPFVVPLRETALYTVSLEAPEHEPLAVDLTFDGTDAEGSVQVWGGDPIAGVAFSHHRERVDERDVWVHRVYLGLRHRWFSASGPPVRHGNDVELLVAGEEAWARAYGDLTGARESILLSTWWWESTFELVRDVGSTDDERRERTILEALEASPAVKRVLVNELLDQDGLLSWVNTDSDLRTHGVTRGDDFELLLQANTVRGRFHWEIEPFSFVDRVAVNAPALAFEPSDAILSEVAPREVDLTEWPVEIDVQHASYHQKFIVVDGDVAYVGGANLRRTDWDTDQHLVYDPRRMDIDASDEERLAVAMHERLPDEGPRRDYMTRIVGPAVEDVADVFHERWEELVTAGVRYSDTASLFDVPGDVPGVPSGVDVQITTTSPEPFDQASIAESWLNAIGRAQRYVYVESQYFRIPMLVEALIERMNEEPELRLVVITKPVSQTLDPGCFWTYRTHEALAERFAGRYLLLQLRSFDVYRGWGIDETSERFTDIDVHSKMLIVDDVFMSVGSTNMNNRGILYEGEMNVAVVDHAWVRAERRRILGNLLGPSGTISDDPVEWYRQLERAAAANQEVRDLWSADGDDLNLNGAAVPARYVPTGFLYPLAFPEPDECFLERIGPDMV